MTAKKTTAQEVQEAEASIAADGLLHRLGAIMDATAHAEKDPTLAAEGLLDVDLADAIATIQDLRARLVNVERDLATALGKRVGKFTGELSDGRQFKLERAMDRKEWDHDEWKRDVRRTIATSLSGRFVLSVPRDPMDGEDGSLVDTTTGEEVTLGRVIQEALTAAQDVHGATSPKSTSLKALGLYASDYCTTQPSGWRFSAIKPTEKITTPTTEEPTNG